MYVSAGLGDAFSSYTAEAVRQIGLWDELYANIGWQARSRPAAPFPAVCVDGRLPFHRESPACSDGAP